MRGNKTVGGTGILTTLVVHSSSPVFAVLLLLSAAGLPPVAFSQPSDSSIAKAGESASSGTGDGQPKHPVVYIAQNEFPEQIIRGLAFAHGYQLAPGSTDRARRASVSGRLTGNSLMDLITQLGRNHGFEHFVHGANIYLFDPSDWRTETIYLGFRPDETLRDNLTQYGLAQPRFKWLLKPEQDSIVVTAPRQYIALLERTLKAERDQNQQDLLVFRLRYAPVEDRVVTLRDRQVVTPGVSTLLRGILSQQQGSRGSSSVGGAALGALSASGTDLPGGQVAYSSQISGGAPAFEGAVASPVGMGGMPLLPGMAAMAPLPGALGASGDVGPPGIQGAGGVSAASAANARQIAGTVRMPVSVQADVRTNSIIIRDRPSREPVYRKLIEALDIPLDMVEIEAVLIDIDQRRLDELGVQWSASTGRLSTSFPASSSLGTLGINGSTAVVTGRTGFVARLQALMADNDARVLARPTILTLDNLSGVIDLTQTFFTKVQGERVANVVPVVAGSMMRVSPRIVRDPSGRQAPEVQLQVDIEDGSLKDRAGLDLPTVQKNAISTQATILSEQAILIGGYTREAEAQTTFRVPFLADLPVIGHLMQSRNSSTQKMTRLFLITPRVVNAGTATGQSVEGEIKSRFDGKSRQGLENLLPKMPSGRLSTELSFPDAPKNRPSHTQPGL